MARFEISVVIPPSKAADAVLGYLHGPSGLLSRLSAAFADREKSVPIDRIALHFEITPRGNAVINQIGLEWTNHRSESLFWVEFEISADLFLKTQLADRWNTLYEAIDCALKELAAGLEARGMDAKSAQKLRRILLSAKKKHAIAGFEAPPIHASSRGSLIYLLVNAINSVTSLLRRRR